MYILPKLWTYPKEEGKVSEGDRLFVARAARVGWFRIDWTPVRRVLPGVYIRNGVTFNLDSMGFKYVGRRW